MEKEKGKQNSQSTRSYVVILLMLIIVFLLSLSFYKNITKIASMAVNNSELMLQIRNLKDERKIITKQMETIQHEITVLERSINEAEDEIKKVEGKEDINQMTANDEAMNQQEKVRRTLLDEANRLKIEKKRTKENIKKAVGKLLSVETL